MTEICVTGAWLRKWGKEREKINCDFVAHDKLELTCYGADCSECRRNKDLKTLLVNDNYQPLGTG